MADGTTKIITISEGVIQGRNFGTKKKTLRWEVDEEEGARRSWDESRRTARKSA
jgi:hypothetical protein